MPANETGLTLHAHPLASYCWKVFMALYETGTPFQQKLVEGSPKADPVHAALWPIGKMPVLQDAERATMIPETSIIIEYLQQHYPGSSVMIPEQQEARLEVRLWDRFFDLYVHNSMQKLVSDRLRAEPDKDPAGVADAIATLDTAYAMLQQRMATREFVAGDNFSMADCAAMPPLFYLEAIHPYGKSWPALAAYAARLMDRPSARRTIHESQPYLHFFPFYDTLPERFKNPEAA